VVLAFKVLNSSTSELNALELFGKKLLLEPVASVAQIQDHIFSGKL
jgi:hypothetical protein